MSTPQEHDYIGLSEPPPQSIPVDVGEATVLKTELRLGLPGSESPERKGGGGGGVSLFGKELKDEGSNGILKGFASAGAKRGFSDAINGSRGKWVLSINGGSEADLGKKGHEGLFSPRGNSNTTLNGGGSSSAKEIVSVPPVEEKKKTENGNSAPASKAQMVGWPPIRSFRKNTLSSNLPKNNNDLPPKSGSNCLYVKVSMDGAPYLRKIDLKTYRSYAELSSALEKMFSCFTIGQYGQGLAGQDRLSESHLMDLLHGSEYVLTYEDKDGDWMLVGDVPWEMFTDSCKRLRIMKGSDAIGLAPRTMQKCKSQN